MAGRDSVFAVALGANYQLTEKLAIRGGYQYNTNPLASTSMLFNLQSPAILQHLISVGSTVNPIESLSMSKGYAYGMNSRTRSPAPRGKFPKRAFS